MGNTIGGGSGKTTASIGGAIIGTLVGLNSLRSTFFPEMESRLISVQVLASGLSPLEIEESITKKVEYKVESVSGVKDITSSSSENIAMINIEMERGANMYIGLQNINNAIDQIRFNVDVEEIFIRKIEFVMPTISFSINSNNDLDYLHNVVNDIEDELKSVDGISEISITGMPEKEVEIAVDIYKMMASKVSFYDVIIFEKRLCFSIYCIVFIVDNVLPPQVQ